MRRLFVLLVVGLFVLGACSSDDSESSDDDSSSAPPDAPADDDEGDDEGDGGDESASAGSGGGTATLTLDNGETFEFGALCALEPQESAGSTIEYAVASYDDPYNLDINKFGEDSFGGEASVSVYDSESYEVLWEGSSSYPEGALVLSLEGTTITGSGTFHPDGDITVAGVEGTIVAEC